MAAGRFILTSDAHWTDEFMVNDPSGEVRELASTFFPRAAFDLLPKLVMLDAAFAPYAGARLFQDLDKARIVSEYQSIEIGVFLETGQ